MAEKDIDEQTPPPAEASSPGFPTWVIWAVGLLALLLVAFAVLIVATGRDLRTYTNHGGGMLPTIRLGQEINADQGDRTPQVGDIIVFHPPSNAESALPRCGSGSAGVGSLGRTTGGRMCDVAGPTEASATFVKRVVGLPGDHLALVGGHVIRNGARERDAYTMACGDQSYCNFSSPIAVPAGTYYVLGDNRGASDDSRFWGPINRSWVVGVLVHCSLLDSFCSKLH